MKHDTTDLWMVCYDIRCPRRLRKVHRRLKAAGIAIQYSGFCVQAHELALQEILDDLSKLIDHRLDDVRAYRLPHDLKMWTLGSQTMPDEVVLTGADALMTVLGGATAPAHATVDATGADSDDVRKVFTT